MRTVRCTLAALLCAIVPMLFGCGSEEHTLSLANVKDALHASGLKDLHVLTKDSTSGVGVAFSARTTTPDYLQDPTKALLVVRFQKVSEAVRVLPKARSESGAGFSVRATRTCNVVVLDYKPHAASAEALAARIARALRERCR